MMFYASSRRPVVGPAFPGKPGILEVKYQGRRSGAPNRLSVDFDYNCIAHAKREEMLIDRLNIEKSPADIAARVFGLATNH